LLRPVTLYVWSKERKGIKPSLPPADTGLTGLHLETKEDNLEVYLILMAFWVQSDLAKQFSASGFWKYLFICIQVKSLA